MSPETVAAIFAGLTALVAAISTFTANRQRQQADQQRRLRKHVRELETQLVALMGHTFTLELAIARAGGIVPPRPPVVEKIAEESEENGR